MRHQHRKPIRSESDLLSAHRWLDHMVPEYLLRGDCELVLKRPTRTLDQNARMWAMLGDVASQVVWYGKHLSPDDWKHVFTASLKRQEAVPGIDGGFVVLGQSTSQMSIETLSELMELIAAFGAEHGVVWSEPEQRKAS